jgi:c-di-GMP-binding flagellar brake protein YcgR
MSDYSAPGTATQQPDADRRRVVRLAVEAGAEAGIVSTNSVRVVDISVGGVMLMAPRPAPVGTRGRLSLTIGGSPLAAEVEIRRVVQAPDRGSYRIGAMFLDITPAQRETIERLARS